MVRPENFEATVSKMAAALGITFCPPYENREAGVLVAVNWEAGIELLTPLPTEAGKQAAAILEQKGEGWLSVVFGVGDLDHTGDRMQRLGHQLQARFSTLKGDEPWFGQFSRLDEAIYDPAAFGGLPMTFSMIEEKVGKA
jgi:hypothetical protein